MPIQVLSQSIIDKIAAGEVVERPSSVVKELVENAIDAGATKISVETKDGGITLIRVTDNGSGIRKEELAVAFLPHATSKIRSIEDLEHLGSLGFRGEALPSIAAVSEVEVLTKTREDAAGALFSIRGGVPGETEEIGIPDGTTFLVRNLFYNTPARRAFLKTPMTEASYVGDLLEKLAFSHPEIAFKWTSEGRVRLDTPGNDNLKALIYSLYGRETAAELVEVRKDEGYLKVRGFLGKPVLAKGNRNFELYFVNGRFVRNKIAEKAIEDAYQPFMMQHRYPFLVLFLELSPEEFDVNVHPSKLEIRFRKEGTLYDELFAVIKEGLTRKEFIPGEEEKEERPKGGNKTLFKAPEPFETNFSDVRDQAREKEFAREIPAYLSGKEKETAEAPEKPVLTPFRPKDGGNPAGEVKPRETADLEATEHKPETPDTGRDAPGAGNEKAVSGNELKTPVQETFLHRIETKAYRVVGQVFDTYWVIETEDGMYLMDQHAAHEKVLYEAKMLSLREKKPVSQFISPPVIVTLGARESAVLTDNLEWFSEFGYEIRPFGGREFAVSAIPSDLFGLDVRSFFEEVIGAMTQYPERKKDPEMLLQKIATMSCKAAVKGNSRITETEAEALIAKLLTLENPYACPHGRPTLIRFTKEDIEKRFKRIVS